MIVPTDSQTTSAAGSMHVHHQVLHADRRLERRHRRAAGGCERARTTDKRHEWREPQRTYALRGNLINWSSRRNFGGGRPGPRREPRHLADVRHARARRRALHRRRNAAASVAGTSAHTLPPKPGAEAARRKRADARAPASPSGSFPGSGCRAVRRASRCESAASSPSAARSASRNATAACGARAVSRMKCCSRRAQVGDREPAIGSIGSSARRQLLDRLRARRQRVGQRPRRCRGVPVPDRVQRADAVGGAVVAILDRVGLVGLDAARRDHERPVRRHARVAERPDRHEAIEADVIGLAGEDRGVILAAAVRADAGGSRAGRESPARSRRSRDTTRDRARAAGAAATRRDRAGPRARSSASATPDHERARAAQAGGARQVAGDRDVGAEIAAGKVEEEAVRDDVHVALQAAVVRRRRLRRIDFDHLAVEDVADAHDAVGALARRERDAARHGGEQRMAAGVVGVLAEDLDPARREAPPVAARRRGSAPRCFSSSAKSAARDAASAGVMPSDSKCARDRVHGRGSRPTSRALTSATSDRRDRSSTAPGRAARRGRRTPLAIASADRFRQFVFAARRQRHIAARVEDALVESPHVHADERARSACVVIVAAGFFDDARQVAAIIDFDRGKARHAIARESRCRAPAIALVRRQAGTVEARRARAAPPQDTGCRS